TSPIPPAQARSARTKCRATRSRTLSRPARPLGRRSAQHGGAATWSKSRDVAPAPIRYRPPKPVCLRSSPGLHRGKAMADALRHQIDQRYGDDQHQQDRTDIGVIEFADRNEQVLADAASADKADDRAGPYVYFKTQQRIAGDIRQDLRQGTEAHNL